MVERQIVGGRRILRRRGRNKGDQLIAKLTLALDVIGYGPPKGVSFP